MIQILLNKFMLGKNQKNSSKIVPFLSFSFLSVNWGNDNMTHITGLPQPLQKIINNHYCEQLPIFSILSKINMYYIYYRNKCCF